MTTAPEFKLRDEVHDPQREDLPYDPNHSNQFLNPSYDDSDNIFLILYAFGNVQRLLHFGVAHLACTIVAEIII